VKTAEIRRQEARPPLCLAAAVTPLTGDGSDVDPEGCAEVAAYLAGHGVDGIFALGTTGEGLLLSHDERRRATRAFVAGAGDVPVIVHAGALTTQASVELCASAAADGAAAVAALAPPGQRLDDAALVEYFTATAKACSPIPFYAYVYTARSGYPVTPDVLARARDRVANLIGAKVSDPDLKAVDAFLGHGYEVFVGAESLIPAALNAGAGGVVSGLAGALPEFVVHAVHARTDAAGAEVRALRSALGALPLHAALKRALVRIGLTIDVAVRPPLRPLTTSETRRVDDLIERYLGAPPPAAIA
jgi:dihydrodipicolinate synthase/N-acetylneuraminate lyase